MGDSSELKREKRELRGRILQKRDALSDRERETYSRQIAEKLLELPEMKRCRNVLCYMDFQSEVRTGYLIDGCVRAGKAVWIPKVVNSHVMRFYRYTGPDSLTVSRWGVREPFEDDDLAFPREKVAEGDCFAVIPGTVFDKSCGRMGYSGGFYDRFLSGYPQIFACGICFSCQIADTVPMGEFDVRMDMVVTEKEVYRNRAGE